MRRGRGEGEEGKEVPFLSLPPFFASLLPLFPLGTPDTQATGKMKMKQSGFSFEAGGRTFRSVVFHSMSGTLMLKVEGFFIVCYYYHCFFFFT